MITAYSRQGDVTEVSEVTSLDGFPSGVCWIDALHPTDEELEMIQTRLKVNIPDKNEVWKNHTLNRFYAEDDVFYMTAGIINKVHSPYPEVIAVTFILGETFFLTVRDIEPTSFRNFAARLQKTPRLFADSASIGEALFEEMIMRVAYNSEIVVDALDGLSHRIFSPEAFREEKTKKQTHIMKTVLKTLGGTEDLNSKITESLASISRMLVFFKQAEQSRFVEDTNVDILISDVNALMTQSAFLSDKITFQLDATLGMINVEQNLIIKIFSIVTVFFLPATLVSSIYGMNFMHMPELHWIWGYPFALFLMIMCAVVPHVYLKKKGWL